MSHRKRSATQNRSSRRRSLGSVGGFHLESLETRQLMAGDGLAASYFNNSTLSGTAALTRVDSTVNFNWGLGSPATGIGVDKFSARWTGKIQAPSTGEITFYATSDDGVRLWVNNQIVVDKWTRHAMTTYHGGITLAAGQTYDIKMEYYELASAAVAKLYWSSASIAREIVPQSALFSGVATTSSSDDKTPPTTPKSLATTMTTDTSVALSWVHSTDNVAISRYDIYRDGAKIGSTRAVSFTDTGLSANSTHNYFVKAVDSSSNSSAPSGALSVTTLAFYDGEAPSAPNNLFVVGKTDSSITMSWDAASDNVGVSGYDVYRDGSKVASVDGSTTTYTDLYLAAGSLYSYTVVARDGAGNVSDASNSVSQITDTSSPTGSGSGLQANYFDNTDFTSQKLTRTDSTVNFNWSGGSPDASIGNGSYAVRWTGKVEAKYSEQYVFYTYTNAGVRLWVNNRLIINDWTSHAAKEDSASSALLTQGQLYTITMEYWDDATAGQAKLSWSSSTQGKQVIPQLFLYPGDSVTAPPIAGNWTLDFNDDFNTLNTSVWGNRYWWNGDKGQQVTFTPNNVAVANGVLTITAKKQTATAYDGTVNQYTSGLLTTGGTKDGSTAPGFSYTYGYMEARIKIPAGQGLWPSFWALPANYDDYQGELDAMEIVASRPNIHEMHYHRQGWEYGGTFDAGKSLGDDYHVYALDWEPDHISWYIDGVEKLRYTSQSSKDIVNQAMYLILNLDAGGQWAGNIDSTTPIPAQMNVDYVRVWQQAR